MQGPEDHTYYDYPGQNIPQNAEDDSHSEPDPELDPSSGDDYYDDGWCVIGEEGSEDYVHSTEVQLLALKWIKG